MHSQGKLLVGFKSNTSAQHKKSIHQKCGTTYVKKFSLLNVEVIKVPKGKEEHYKKMYLKHDNVAFVDFNMIRKINYFPNDPFYLKPIKTSQGRASQWGLRRIIPEKAFDKVKNLSPVRRIAIIDSGIDPNHPDLADKIIDPINFSSRNRRNYIDRIGHGTHVAGIAAAITNNRIGVAGASFNTAKIIPIKAGNEELSSEAIIRGIFYAIRKGADVINMSFGGPTYNQAEQLAMEIAWKKGIVLVAAGGNEGHEQPSYPAAYNFVLGVSATDHRNRLAPFSNWGVYIGITAPGTNILSTTPTYPVPDMRQKYDALQGTSMSAPFVSGVAVMLKRIKPQASNQEIIQAIQKSAQKLNTSQKQWIPFYGYGLLNASKAVTKLLSPGLKYKSESPPLGSFYGQVIDQHHCPIEGITIIAFSNKTDQEVREYQTKADGMFRLFNLPKGNYLIGYLPEGTNVAVSLIDSINIVPGADIYLKLVIRNT